MFINTLINKFHNEDVIAFISNNNKKKQMSYLYNKKKFLFIYNRVKDKNLNLSYDIKEF